LSEWYNPSGKLVWERAVDSNDVREASRSSVAVSLLGSLRVVRYGADATLAPSRKVRALMAYLAMAPRPIHRAKLCELLWDVPDDPRGELRWCLTKIRALLDDPTHKRVKAENDWVSIDTSTMEVDALWVAARAEAAISGGDLDLLKQLETKFEGEFLEGFEADRIPLFETWLIGERQRFQSLHAEVLSRIIALLSRTEEGLPYIRKRLDLQPYDLAAHRDLLVTLAACGRFAEGDIHMEAATHLFGSQGLNSAALDKDWREHRQLATRETRPESLPSRVVAPASVEAGSAAHRAEVKAVPPRLSIVVLPFANLGGDPEQEYFADGVTDSLTTDLSRISGAFVIGRSTAFTYKGRALDVRQIARELNVRYVLEGSVQRGANRLRVNVQLLEAETASHIWAERFDKPVTDLFDMQEEIVSRLASALGQELAGAEARRAAAPGPEPPPASPHEAAPRAPERRHITALAVELAPAQGGRLPADPEELGAIVGAFRRYTSSVLTQYGAAIGHSRGREILAYFGYPTAQENDAERAVRAALAIQRALSEHKTENMSKGSSELSARIGLECGLAVVDSTAEVFGDAPDVAARLLTAADPGTVLVTANVQRQTAGLFVAEDRGAHELKGVPAPLTLYRIVRASGGRRVGARTLTVFVGREEELDLLRRRWDRARNGAGQLTLIVGEPGIGKSRLVAEFRATLGETPHTFVEWSSSQLLQNTPLHPVADWGRQRFGADEPAERRLADLENTLRLIGLDPAEYAPLLAPLIDVGLPEERAAKFAPEELRRRQLAALTAWVLAGARSQPVVLAFEDLHWADPTSLDLMQALAERGARAPLFILATARPEFRPPWSLRSHHSVISLSPLGRADVARMVGELAARHALSKEVVEGVSERTGGVPLFVEEVTRLLLERGDAGGLQAIPPTLQQSLAARLDRLGEAREVAQIGAALGRDFTYSLLSAVGGVDDLALQSALDRLAGADLLIAEGAGAQANYRFKHVLIQDAAYESLLKSRRRALHRRAAEILRDQPDRAAAEPEVIAHHFTEAGLDDLAIEWWGKAGDQALRRSAFQEAIAHLGKAIAMADKAAQAQGLPQLHVAYGNALIAARGYTAPETIEAFARARESALGDADAPERLGADYGLWVGNFVRGELPSTRTHASAFLADVEARPNSPEAGVAHRAVGQTHWFAGEYREAREHLERALALFQPGRDDNLAFRFGNDAGVAAMLYLALTLWPLGDVGRAISLIGDAEARIAGLAHIGTRAHGKSGAAMFELMRGALSRAASKAAELATLSREHELKGWRALDGLSTAGSGAVSGGLENMRRSVQLLREENVVVFDGLVKTALAEAEARAGDVGRALAILDEALATSERIGHHTFDAELNRARGEMLLKRDPANPAPAEEALQTAIAVAKRQATRSFELRAALSLAKLYQSTARPADAHAILAPALEGFAPTPEMPEIAEAQARLATLA
jgi:TolB-like protein/DNA-binding SARP family transcriptional activator/tetratricopeptide (TPR) repeat protein